MFRFSLKIICVSSRVDFICSNVAWPHKIFQMLEMAFMVDEPSNSRSIKFEAWRKKWLPFDSCYGGKRSSS